MLWCRGLATYIFSALIFMSWQGQILWTFLTKEERLSRKHSERSYFRRHLDQDLFLLKWHDAFKELDGCIKRRCNKALVNLLSLDGTFAWLCGAWMKSSVWMRVRYSISYEKRAGGSNIQLKFDRQQTGLPIAVTGLVCPPAMMWVRCTVDTFNQIYWLQRTEALEPTPRIIHVKARHVSSIKFGPVF